MKKTKNRQRWKKMEAGEGARTTMRPVTTGLQVDWLRSQQTGAAEGGYGMTAGCKFGVKITLSSLPHPHTHTHFDSQRLPFLQVLLCQSEPPRPSKHSETLSAKSTLTGRCCYSGSFLSAPQLPFSPFPSILILSLSTFPPTFTCLFESWVTSNSIISFLGSMDSFLWVSQAITEQSFFPPFLVIIFDKCRNTNYSFTFRPQQPLKPKILFTVLPVAQISRNWIVGR